MDGIVEVRDLSKSYGTVDALRGLDLSVPEGEVFAFLGRNGAGKTTTLRILVGITQADGGSVELFGESIVGHHVRLRQRVGYVAQEQNFYGWMTPKGLGDFVRGFYPSWDDDHYYRMLRTSELPLDRKIQTFSGGMKAKLALSLALAHRPPLLILDEPTAGLDPVARREFLGMVREQSEGCGHTTLFSSHLVDEVERVAHRVGIVEQGRTLYQGELEHLSEQVRVLHHPCPTQEFSTDLAGLSVLREGTHQERREVVVRANTPELLEQLQAGLPEWSLERMRLEDIFVAMVARRAV